MPPRNQALAPGTLREALGDQAAGDALRGRQRLAARRQQTQHDVLQFLVLDAEDQVAEAFADGLLRPARSAPGPLAGCRRGPGCAARWSRR